MRPSLYQVLHPWHWITYGQNSSAVGATAAGLAAIAAAVAGIFAVRTYNATLEQLAVSRNQAELAATQMLSQLRPVLLMRSRVNPNLTKGFSIENVGSGAAHRISWDYIPAAGLLDEHFDRERDLERQLNTNLLIANAEEPISVDKTLLSEMGLMLKYFSSDGRIFITRLQQLSDGPLTHQQIDPTEPIPAENPAS
jgi:hypothetical protein